MLAMAAPLSFCALQASTACTIRNAAWLLSFSLDGGIPENLCQAMTCGFSTKSSRNSASSMVMRVSLLHRRKSGSLSEAARRSRCNGCCAAHASSLHLNFQLPSKSFAGCERDPLGCDLECKSAPFNPHFGGSEKLAKEENAHPNLGFYLHNLMDQAGIETTHARVARVGFAEEVAKLGNGPLASESKDLVMVDVARAALEIAAEDDALVSHSSVPLPVDSYLQRLDSMATEFAGHHLPAYPFDVFEALENYLWNYKGFRSTKSRSSGDGRDFYLNGVLTRRQGPPLMLGLIYSEVVKRLWRSGVIDFLADINMPVDDLSFPLPIYKKPEGSSMEDEGKNTEQNWPLAGGSAELEKLDQDLLTFKNQNRNLLTPKNLLLEILRSLKKLYWPWKSVPSLGEGSDFLEAAVAASRGPVSSASTSHGPFESLFNAPSSERGSEVARARAAQYRLQRGIWTSTTFGDLRRALAASERLVILGGDRRELRDYGMLLFHAGLYEQAFQYLKYYSSCEEVSNSVPLVFNPLEAQLEAKEAVALDRLMERLSLILTERSWNVSSDPPPPIVSPPDPW